MNIEKVLKSNNVKFKVDVDASNEKSHQFVFEIEEFPGVFGILAIKIMKNKLYYYSYNLENTEEYLNLLKDNLEIKKVIKMKEFNNYSRSPLENLLSFFKISTTKFTTLRLSPKAIKFYGVEVC